MKTKILIIRFSSIGDIVLTSPVVRCLKNQLEDVEIHFVTKEKFAGIVQPNPYITKVHLLTDNLTKLISALKRERFDYVIDLHHNLRSYRLKRALNVQAFSVDKLNLKKLLLIKMKINLLPEVHIVNRYLDTVAHLGIVNDQKGLDYFIPEKERFKISDLPEPFQNGYVAFVIAGTYSTKRLPFDKVAKICHGIDFPVILLGGKQELDDGEKILATSKGNILNYAGKINLGQSASIVENAKLVLTNDTGLMHIAAAFKKKILSFWGNTVPAFGMVPYLADEASELLEVSGLKCRPCSKLGFHSCPKKHFRCMADIDTNAAIRWISQHFQS
ncbi:MAG: glycosyl transferase [Draconibacterium sp.]|nr:MAG: glycosyl transferase [Draconibacterium sp.]